MACGTAWAQDAAPAAGTEELEEITVTGSRTITEAIKSPTPITSVSIAEIAATTPSDTADALNKLPSILGGRTPRTQGNGSTNNGGNTLSLRNFGATRTLVLLDGHRVAPNNQDGSVNIDVLPQMLVESVDIVTGGASAIYGSDAVAGVVNYRLKKDFTGLTLKGDFGRSKYNDGDQYQVGAAWGTSLFSDRGHLEASARFRHQDMIPMADRPYGENGQAWLLTGSGSVANPFTNTPYGRVVNQSSFGTINCGSACPVNGQTFHQAGVISPFVNGTPTRVPGNIQSGGDGGWVPYGTFRSEVEMKDVFGRFSLDLGEKANWYVQGAYAQAENASDWINWVVSAAGGRPNTLFADNPYLSSAAQAQLGATTVNCGTTPQPTGWRCLPATPPVSQQTNSQPPAPGTTVPIFSAPSYIWNNVGGQPANGNPNRMYRTLGDQKTWNVETGLTGEFGNFTWDVFFNHAVSDLTVTNPNNTDNAKYLAALDAVSVNGTIQCWVTTQPQFAGLYPGCVPVNVVDPAGPSAAAYDYLRTETSWNLVQKMDNVGASIGGPLGFGLPAGDINGNVSIDARWSDFTLNSDFLPTDYVNCTGLRMCLANPPNPARPDLGAPLRWVQNTNAPVDANNHVYEGALEFNVPLVKDVPGFQELTANLAGRYTKYSTFDDAQKSWKLGLNWQAVDFLRFRGTLSADIRAPNLYELYQPLGVTSTGFRDLLTGKSDNTRLATSGNADLTPEEGKTLTVGAVFTPAAIQNFSVSVDYYQTRLTNAIINVSYQGDAIQNLCLGSAPAYDNPYCSLVSRPITNPNDPNFRNGNLNYPTEVRSKPFNAALLKTKGYDLQLDYRVDVGGGSVSLRHLATYQPVNSTLNNGARFYTWAVQPKLMQTTFINYKNQSWTVALQNRWLSSVNLKTSSNLLNGNSQNYVDPSLDAYNVVDVTVSKDFEIADGTLQGFLTVSNLTNERAPLFPSNSGLPGLFYPTLGFYDDMGRFFTAGFNMKF